MHIMCTGCSEGTAPLQQQHRANLSTLASERKCVDERLRSMTVAKKKTEQVLISIRQDAAVHERKNKQTSLDLLESGAPLGVRRTFEADLVRQRAAVACHNRLMEAESNYQYHSDIVQEAASPTGTSRRKAVRCPRPSLRQSRSLRALMQPGSYVMPSSMKCTRSDSLSQAAKRELCCWRNQADSVRCYRQVSHMAKY